MGYNTIEDIGEFGGLIFRDVFTRGAFLLVPIRYILRSMSLPIYTSLVGALLSSTLFERQLWI
jgi:hypothetical protein